MDAVVVWACDTDLAATFSTAVADIVDHHIDASRFERSHRAPDPRQR
jgi:hypothetical protein